MNATDVCRKCGRVYDVESGHECKEKAVTAEWEGAMLDFARYVSEVAGDWSDFDGRTLREEWQKCDAVIRPALVNAERNPWTYRKCGEMILANEGLQKRLEAAEATTERVRETGRALLDDANLRLAEAEKIAVTSRAYDDAMKATALHWLNCATCQRGEGYCMPHYVLRMTETLAMHDWRAALAGEEK